MISSDSLTPTIHHQPYGEQHPYDALPCERIPRDPSAGELVILGVQTAPIGIFDEIWAGWQSGDHPQETIVFGKRIGHEGDMDQWRIHLPTFTEGAQVTYRVWGRAGGKEYQTELFMFSVPSWVVAERAVILEKKADRLSALLLTDRVGLIIKIDIILEKEQVVHLRFSQIQPSDNADLKPFSGSEVKLNVPDIKVALRVFPFTLRICRQEHELELCGTSLSFLLDANGQVSHYRLGFASPPDEAFYGFGERFNTLDQRGNCLDMTVYDQPKNQGKRSYIPIPFFLSSRGYGVWVNSQRWMKFDLAANHFDCWQFECEVDRQSAQADLFFFLGNGLLDILGTFANLNGKPVLPPDWAFGLWMSSNDWDNQDMVLKQLYLSEQHQIPASVIVIEAWSDEATFYIWNDALYNLKPASEAYRLSDFAFPASGRWPDPKAMVDEIHRSGMRLVLWQIPVIRKLDPGQTESHHQSDADKDYAIQEGYCVRMSSGKPYEVQPPWFHGSFLIDFTNPKAVAWWFNKRTYLLEELDVDGFKTDGGEHLWTREAVFFDGSRSNERANTYPLLYQQAYNEFLKSRRGDDKVLFSRSGYTGAQLFPCHWMGDENSTWEAFRSSLHAMLNVSVSGVPFVGWDMAGFGGELPSSELYLRAVATSVFCPIMQFHSEHSEQEVPCQDRTPWNIQETTGDSDVIPLFRHFANLRMNLLPYILSQAWLVSQSGFPLMRALPLQFPNDAACRRYPLEFCFGEALLVAPVVESGKTIWQVYLPQGDWRDLWNGELYSGPQKIVVPAPLGCIPVFQRKGTILPLNLSNDMILCSPVGNAIDQYKNLCLLIYPDGDCEAPLYKGSWGESRWVKCSGSEETKLEVYLPPFEDALHIFMLEVLALEVLCDGKPLTKNATSQTNPSDHGWTLVPEKRITQIDLLASPRPRKVTIRKQ